MAIAAIMVSVVRIVVDLVVEPWTTVSKGLPDPVTPAPSVWELAAFWDWLLVTCVDWAAVLVVVVAAEET